jgi:hypothetical protein
VSNPETLAPDRPASGAEPNSGLTSTPSRRTRRDPAKHWLFLVPVALVGYVHRPILGDYFKYDDFLHLYQIANFGVLEFLITPHGGHLLASSNFVFVVCEALFIEASAHSLTHELPPRAPGTSPLTRASFIAFYAPLAMTPLMALLVQPIGAAAMSRMPDTLTSLAAWPAVHGLVFLFRGVGLSFNEVVVRLAGEPDGMRVLQRIARTAALGMMGLLLLLALSPLGELWFVTISGLPGGLASVSQKALLLAALMPGYAVLQSWYQGALMHVRRTRPIPEAVALYLLVSASLLALGVAYWDGPGIYYAIPTLTAAGLTQTAWLWLRSRSLMRQPAGL